MKDAWEAAATFFRGRVHFLDVDCGSGPTAKAFCDAQNVTSYPVVRLFSATRESDAGAEALAGRGLPSGGAFAVAPLASLPAGYRDYRADWTGSRSLAGLEWALHTHRSFLPREGPGEGAAVAPAFDVRGEDVDGVQSIFGLDGREATVRLADYASLPASPADQDAAALEAQLGLGAVGGREALEGEGRSDFVAEPEAGGGAGEEEDDEDEEWALLDGEEEPVML